MLASCKIVSQNELSLLGLRNLQRSVMQWEMQKKDGAHLLLTAVIYDGFYSFKHICWVWSFRVYDTSQGQSQGTVGMICNYTWTVQHLCLLIKVHSLHRPVQREMHCEQITSEGLVMVRDARHKAQCWIECTSYIQFQWNIHTVSFSVLSSCALCRIEI